MAMAKDQFIEHMEEYYRNLSDISENLPTADMILSGKVPIPTNLSIQDSSYICRNMHYYLVGTIGYYETPNSIVNEKLTRWLSYLGTLNQHMHVFFLRGFYLKYPHLFSDIDIETHFNKYFKFFM